MSGKVTQECTTGKEGLGKIFEVVMKCLAEGALSVKLTQEATKAMQAHLTEKPTDEEVKGMPTLFTLPNGVSTASILYIADEWLAPSVLEYMEEQGCFKPYQIIKHFIAEIDKIKVEVI